MRTFVWLTAGAAVVMLALIISLVRRKQLAERYAILWLATGVLLVPVAIMPSLLDRVARRLGVADAPNLWLFLGLVFLSLVCIHLTWEISRLEARSRAMAEQIAVLGEESRQTGARDV